MGRSSSSTNMLGVQSQSAQKTPFLPSHNTPTSMTFMNPMKDQHTISASASNANLLSQPHGLAGTSTTPTDQMNSTSVTPFLKPTARHPEHKMHHTLSSPFLKSATPTNQYANYASLMSGSGQ